jgi:hypothetical protein
LVKYHSRERVVSASLKALEFLLRESEADAQDAVALLAIQGKLPETVPLLIKALDARSPSLRAVAVRGLENATSVPPRELGYSERDELWTLAAVQREPQADSMAALADVVARWKEWWERAGHKFLRDRGIASSGGAAIGAFRPHDRR